MFMAYKTAYLMALSNCLMVELVLTCSTRLCYESQNLMRYDDDKHRFENQTD